jgi:hypothetical protein
MPVLQMPDGKLIRFPDDMPRAEIKARIAAAYPGAYAPKVEKKPGLMDLFSEGYERGDVGISAAYRDVIPAVVMSALGDEKYAKEKLAIAEAKRQEEALRNPAVYGGMADIQGPGDILPFMAEKTGETAPIIRNIAAASLGGKLLRAGKLGQRMLQGAAVTPVLTSEAFEGIFADTGELAPGVAYGAGVVNTALETIAPLRFLRSFSPSLQKAVVREGLKKAGVPPTVIGRAITGGVRGAITEGLTEGAQQSINIAAENFVGKNPQIFDSEDWRRVAESVVAGAAVGTPLGTVGGAARGSAEGSRIRRENAELEIRQQQEAQAQEAAADKAAKEVADKAAADKIIADQAAALKIPSDPEGLKKWGLTNLGIAPGALILRPDGPLAGKDLTDPAQAAEVKVALQDYLKTATNPEIIKRVKAVIRNLEPEGLVSEPKVKDKVVVDEVKAEAAGTEAAVEDEITTGVTPKEAVVTTVPPGFATEETEARARAEAETAEDIREDIPQDKPVWSKELLGFLTNEYDVTEQELAGLNSEQMLDLLADAESDGAVFDGPMVEDTEAGIEEPTIITDETVEQVAAELVEPAEIDEPVTKAEKDKTYEELAVERNAIDAAKRQKDFELLLEDDGIGQLKDPEKALLVYQELGVNEQEGFDLTDEDFDALVREATRQRSLRKPVVEEATAPEANEAPELSDEELNALLANAPDKETSKALQALAANRAAALDEKPSAKKAAETKPAEDKPAVEVIDTPESRIKEARLETIREAAAPREQKDIVSTLANKKVSDNVVFDISELKRQVGPKKAVAGKKLTPRQIAVNYFHKFGPAEALAVLVAEANPEYTEPETFAQTEKRVNKKAEFKTDPQRALEWVQKNMSVAVNNAVDRNIKFVEQTLEDLGFNKENAERRATSEKTKKSATSLKVDLADTTRKMNTGKGAKIDAKDKKGLPDRVKIEAKTPEEKEEAKKKADKERRDDEAESLAAKDKDVKAAEKELPERSEYSKERQDFIDNAPAEYREFYTRRFDEIKLENPKFTPKQINNAIVEQHGDFFNKTPAYVGPELDESAKKNIAEGSIRRAVQSVIAARNARGADKDLTDIIKRLNNKVQMKTAIYVQELTTGGNGSFNALTNVISLSPTTGLNEHTLLHETTHAVVAQPLNDPDLKITKEFTKFFEEIKLELGDAYGGRNLQEFAAEYVGNGEFQALLKEIRAPKSANMFVRILDSILNYLGYTTGSTAYKEAGKLLSKVIDVSNKVKPSLAETLYLGSGNVDSVMQAVEGNLARRTNEQALRTLSKAGVGLKTKAFGASSLYNTATLLGDKLPVSPLITALETKRGFIDKGIDLISKNVQEMAKIERAASRAKYEALNDFAIDARLEGIDIFKPEPTGSAGKAKYKKLVARFNNLDSKGDVNNPQGLQLVYKKVREELDRYLKEYVDVITELLPETAASNLMKQFATLEGVTAYVPYTRDGDFWLVYNDITDLDADGNPVEVSISRESPREIDQEISRLEAQFKASKFSGDFKNVVSPKRHKNINDVKAPKGLPEGRFVTQLITEMRKNEVDPDVIDNVYQQYISMFPAKSIMQQFKKAKGKPGMDRDLITAYANTAIKWSNKLATTQYNPRIEMAIKAIEDTNAKGDSTVEAAKESIVGKKEFLLNPNFNPMAAGLTYLSYIEFILGSVSSAVVNLTGLIFMVTPMLGARTTYNDATRALVDAGRVAMNGDTWGTGKYKNLYEQLDNRGLLKHTTAREALERGKTKGKDFSGLQYKVVDLFSIPFSASERYMRATTAIAAFDLAMEFGIPSEGVPANNERAAIDFAAKMTRDAHTGGMAETMPRWMQNDFGRVIWTFKNIVFQQAFVVINSLAMAIANKNLAGGQISPEARRVAIRQVLGTYGLSYALLGAKGMPLVGAMTTLMTMAEKLLRDEDDDEPYNAREQLREVFGQTMYDGMLATLLNIDLSSRAALGNDILWRDDPKSIEDFGYVRTVLFSLAGPMGSYFIGTERAIEDFKEGRYARGFEGVFPTAARNLIKTWRFSMEGARNRDGDPIDTDFSSWNLLTQAIGFIPADLSNTYQQRAAAKEYENAVLKRKQDILNAYKQAKYRKDPDAIREAQREAANFRRQFPALMDERTLERSWAASRKNNEQTRAGITFTKNLRYKTDEFFD